jgi:regulatory protein
VRPGADEATSLLDQALALAYRYLNRRERTSQEVRRHLEQKRVEARLAEQVVAALTAQGYLDDTRFARLFVQDKRELEQWGDERIRRGLLARGIDPEVIAAEIGKNDVTETSETEFDRALELLARRFPSPPRDRRGLDRALGVLIRKGYEPELAFDVLTRYARGR